MSYTVNPTVLGSMFAVPASVVDNYIKLASPAQLKTLLWVFRHISEPIDAAKIASEIGYREPDVSDSLVALCEWGVLNCDSKKIEVIQAPEKVEKINEKASKKELQELTIVKPSYEQVVVRCKESPEINAMFSDIQKMLGKTIGYDSQCILIMMHDQYGLPIEVIYMLVNYCVSVGKSNFLYISKVGKDWGEKEIDTIEKADEQIKILNACNGLWKQFAQMAGIQNPRPTASQSAYLRTWSQEMKFNVEMIYLAYEEMLNHSAKISFPYMNKVLSNWHTKGLKTPDDVEKDKQDYRSGKEQKPNSSFDMEGFNRKANELPEYRKG